MKVVKLDRRFTAFKHGFTHAIRLKAWDEDRNRIEDIYKIEAWLQNKYGDKWAWNDSWEGPWKCFRGSKSHGGHIPPFYYAVRDEQIITQILLSL